MRNLKRVSVRQIDEGNEVAFDKAIDEAFNEALNGAIDEAL